MYRFIFFVLLLGANLKFVCANNCVQDSGSLARTIIIDEVQISEVSKKISLGSRVEVFDSLQIANNEGANLGNLIARYSPVYIKSDAGGIASIRMRGTSSTQTAVLFGGFDINSLTLGSSNTTNIPLFLFDNISLQYGSSSAENGSGSIGGSVRLGLEDRWVNGYHVELFGQAGSFGERMEGVKIALGNGRWESTTRIYDFRKKNDFTFNNTLNYDFNTESFTREVQTNASVHNQGLIQELKYRFSEKEWLKGMTWIENDWHQAQPTMPENNSPSYLPKTLSEKNQRTWIEYQNKKHLFQWSISGGYSRDRMIDSSTDTSKISTQRWSSILEFQQPFWINATYKLGAQYQYILPDVYAYDSNIKEQRVDLYASIYKPLFRGLSLSLNLRQQYVSHFKAPFTPSLGLSYLLLHSDQFSLKTTGNIARTYRVPTLNDRYWGQQGYQGNQKIEPEEGVSYEGGVKYLYDSNGIRLKSQLQYFYMNIKNWILWAQGANGFEGKNLQRVISKGIEFHADVSCSLENYELSAGMNATYNSAFRKESLNSTDLLFQQLEYSPQWIGNTWVQLSYKNYGLNSDISYTGERYYDQLNKLPHYSLLNAGIFAKYPIGHHKIKLSIQAQNLLSTVYQNQYGYAMPEINYQLILKYIIN